MINGLVLIKCFSTQLPNSPIHTSTSFYALRGIHIYTPMDGSGNNLGWVSFPRIFGMPTGGIKPMFRATATPTQVSLYYLLVFGGRTLFGSHPSGSTHLEVISSPVPDDFVCNHYLSWRLIFSLCWIAKLLPNDHIWKPPGVLTTLNE